MAYEVKWNDIETVLVSCKRVILRGKPGTGKTTTPILIQHAQQKPFYSVTLTDDSSVQECVGHWFPKGGGEFTWHDGPFALAWRGNEGKGGLLVINEITKASGAVLTELYNFLDDESIALKTLPSGEMIRPGPEFKVVATTNDEFQMLPEALLDRFEARITIDVPHPQAIARLAEPYRTFTQNCYKNPKNDVSLRDMYALSNLVGKGVEPRVASACVFGERGDDIIVGMGIGERTPNANITGDPQ
jgi:MoxR-like ATPase